MYFVPVSRIAACMEIEKMTIARLTLMIILGIKFLVPVHWTV